MVDLVAAVRDALRAAADPSLAPGQQAYMKSAMPFLGVRVPEVRRLTRRVVRELGVRDPGQLAAAATVLWDEATHREVAYVDPAWVRSYVDQHELSPLSRREALKRI